MTRRTKQSTLISPVYRGRRLALLLLLLAGIVVMLLRAGYLEVFQQSWLQAQADKRQLRTMTIPPYRGMIMDRNNEALAISSPVESVWVDPSKFFMERNLIRAGIADPDEKISSAAQNQLDELDVNLLKLRETLGMKKGGLSKLLRENSAKQFVYLVRQASPEKAKSLLDLKVPGVGSQNEYRRFYPMAEAISHVIGFTNIEDTGVEGIERSMNEQLAGQQGKKKVIQDGASRLIEDVEQVERMIPGQDVSLSIDRRIQYQAYKILKEQVHQLSAKAGSVVVLDSRTGEILALANMPGFNPNARSKLKAQNYRNRAVMDAFEPGSTIKPLTIAAALEARVIGPNVSINTSPGYLQLGKTKVQDPRDYGALTLDKVLAKSSNVGASKVALLMDPKEHWKFLNRAGFGLRPNSGAPAETVGGLSYYEDWGKVDRASHGYGYGLSVSLLQLAQAYTIFANEGILVPARLLKQTEAPVGRRIMKPENARAVLRMMTAVVKEGATGKLAMIDGYNVAGKTGTAFKYIKKKYRRDRRVVSFIGLAPASDPRLIVAVTLDEPRVERATGGRLVAPMFSKIMSSSLRVLDIPPDDLPTKSAAAALKAGGLIMAVSLTYLLQGVAGLIGRSIPDVDLSSMTLDSREVVDGSVFVALKGLNAHGLDYAVSAEQLGAVAILWEYDATIDVPELKIPLIAVKELPASLGGIAARLYDHSGQKLQIVGITGTDGKTSVSHFLAQAMNASDESCSVIGTLGIGYPSALEKATHTTPDVISVHKNLQRLSTRGSRCVAMEVSSHALDQQRVAGVDFDVAVLTNLTRDHLDYHGTLDAYADAKAKLFIDCQPKAAVVNLNDDFGMRIAESLKQTDVALYGYSVGEPKSFSENTLLASNTHFDHKGLSADIAYLGKKYQLKAAVLGDFNLSNLLAAAGSLIALGYTPEKALEMIATVATVPGRIEKIESIAKQDFLAAVDYAHTPGALESVLNALRVHCTGRLICVFGCGGDRDSGKRSLMASAAERLADIVIATDDNPRYEDPKQIMQDVLKGFAKPESVTVEHDRAVAINKAIALASAGDVVLVAGKGHEQSQLVQGKELPFDDREQIRQALAKLTERAVA